MCLASEGLAHGLNPLLLGDFSSWICPKKKIRQTVTYTRDLLSVKSALGFTEYCAEAEQGSSCCPGGASAAAAVTAGLPSGCVSQAGGLGPFLPDDRDHDQLLCLGQLYIEELLASCYLHDHGLVQMSHTVTSPGVLGWEEGVKVCWPVGQAAGRLGLAVNTAFHVAWCHL